MDLLDLATTTRRDISTEGDTARRTTNEALRSRTESTEAGAGATESFSDEKKYDPHAGVLLPTTSDFPAEGDGYKEIQIEVTSDNATDQFLLGGEADDLPDEYARGGLGNEYRVDYGDDILNFQNIGKSEENNYENGDGGPLLQPFPISSRFESEHATHDLKQRSSLLERSEVFDTHAKRSVSNQDVYSSSLSKESVIELLDSEDENDNAAPFAPVSLVGSKFHNEKDNPGNSDKTFHRRESDCGDGYHADIIDSVSAVTSFPLTSQGTDASQYQSDTNIIGVREPSNLQWHNTNHQDLFEQKVNYVDQMAQPTNGILQQPVTAASANALTHSSANLRYYTPVYIENDPGYIPTWADIVPPPPLTVVTKVTPFNERRCYKLSLFSVHEFALTAVPHTSDPTGSRPSLGGLRMHIRKIARDHGNGKAVFEKDDANIYGRWRIPLSAYHAFHGFLCQDPSNVVLGIPDAQLKIVTLGKAFMDKSYPTAEALMEKGVPRRLANALAPYQRGGVDFVLQKDGRALIADEMGLGKTVQSIASMTCFEKEWPLLIFCPSSARYHWELEMRQWIGVKDDINRGTRTRDMVEGYSFDEFFDGGSFPPKKRSNKSEGRGGGIIEESSSDGFDDDEPERKKKRPWKGEKRRRVIRDESSDEFWDSDASQGNCDSTGGEDEHQFYVQTMELLGRSQIHVLSSSKDAIIPHSDTRVIICSYGLAPSLINKGQIFPGQFRCIIVDESHMLKNKATKRTQALLPILNAADRVVMLSGTPALARPAELYPQLSVLGGRQGWWNDEASFISKYVKPVLAFNGEDDNDNKMAELHTLLTSTVMIRRMKADTLKNLPKKVRECVWIKICDQQIRRDIAESMKLLRRGKGILGQLARAHKVAFDTEEIDSGNVVEKTVTIEEGTAAINGELNERYENGMAQIHSQVAANQNGWNESAHQQAHQMESELRTELDFYGQSRMIELTNGSGYFDGMRIVDSAQPTLGSLSSENEVEPTVSRKAVLNHLYRLTGDAKIPTIIRMMKAWLSDPTKGKVCIFAHHISVLDNISRGAGLSNAAGSKSKFIRIDGSTMPKVRQEQIIKFQTDSTVRIAVLGITAAGVAVTLTAASTVWFAELFWTPATMIQAEDRCHRIGQQAAVRCLYITAKGTLDEVLWKLIEKKFRDLGEFVEGKDKLDMVVHRTYDDEMMAIGTSALDDDDNDNCVDDTASRESSTNDDESRESKGSKSGCESLADLASADIIQHDIEELGLEEQAMLKIFSDDDDDADAVVESSANAMGSFALKQSSGLPKIGSSETSAICLSDDENEAPDGPAVNSEPTDISELATQHSSSEDKNLNRLHSSLRLPRIRLYKMCFSGPLLGIVVSNVKGRVVVRSKTAERVNGLEKSTKPDVGDIIISVNGVGLRHSTPFSDALHMMQHALQTQHVELTFAEDEDFKMFFRTAILPKLPTICSPPSALSATPVLSQRSAAPSDLTKYHEQPDIDTTTTGMTDGHCGNALSSDMTFRTFGNGNKLDVIELLDDD